LCSAPLKDIDMPPLPTPEAWAHIRHEYENTRRSIEDICLAHHLSANTLRRRVKAWGWAMRRPPISNEGPAAVTLPDETAPPEAGVLDPRFRGDERGASAEPAGPQPAGECLQGAAARVMRAIETTSARLTAAHLRETEMAARALASLTRTMRELNVLLAQQKAQAPRQNVDELRASLARKLEAIVAERHAETPRRYLAGWEEFAEANGPGGRSPP
jgi:hypothetical protein